MQVYMNASAGQEVPFSLGMYRNHCIANTLLWSSDCEQDVRVGLPVKESIVHF